MLYRIKNVSTRPSSLHQRRNILLNLRPRTLKSAHPQPIPALAKRIRRRPTQHKGANRRPQIAPRHLRITTSKDHLAAPFPSDSRREIQIPKPARDPARNMVSGSRAVKICRKILTPSHLVVQRRDLGELLRGALFVHGAANV